MSTTVIYIYILSLDRPGYSAHTLNINNTSSFVETLIDFLWLFLHI